LYQADKGYKYFYEMLLGNEMFKKDVKSSIMKMTELTNGSTVQILAGTITGVNAPHPHKARADEVELIDWSILQQFFSMARSERGIQGQNVLSSTRKTLVGSMQKLMDKMESEPSFPFVLRAWCVKEVLERCNDSCAVCRDVVRTSDERSFWDVCKGDARNSDGFYSVRDAKRKFLTLDSEVWDAEWECKKPAKSGLVYKDMPEERFGKYPFNPALDCFCGCDDGFVAPFAFLLMQRDTSDNIFVVRELFGPGVEHSTWIDSYLKPLFAELELKKDQVPIWVDIRATALIAELRKAGFKVRARALGIVDSVRHVKKWVRGVNHPKLFVDSEYCPNLKRQMGLYRLRQGTELPVGEDDDAPDALRYGICGRYPRFSNEEGTDIPVSAGDKGEMAKVMSEREDALSRAGLERSARRQIGRRGVFDRMSRGW
jgi:hypothetical protein